MNIYLARHGQNEDNAAGILNGHRDLPLTALGRTQADELAQCVKALGITFERVYTSPLARASETARIVTEALGLDAPEVYSDLIERDFGVMAGQAAADIERLCAPDIIKTDTVTYFLNPNGAETFPELMERAQRVLADLAHRHQGDGNILLVGHGDFGKMLYGAYYRMDWKDSLTKFHFGNSELLVLSPDSVVDEFHAVRIEQHNH